MFTAKIFDATGFCIADAGPVETIAELITDIDEFLQPGERIEITKETR